MGYFTFGWNVPLPSPSRISTSSPAVAMSARPSPLKSAVVWYWPPVLICLPLKVRLWAAAFNPESANTRAGNKIDATRRARWAVEARSIMCHLFSYSAGCFLTVRADAGVIHVWPKKFLRLCGADSGADFRLRTEVLTLLSELTYKAARRFGYFLWPSPPAFQVP
jgi:hypothetical protein